MVILSFCAVNKIVEEDHNELVYESKKELQFNDEEKQQKESGQTKDKQATSIMSRELNRCVEDGTTDTAPSANKRVARFSAAKRSSRNEVKCVSTLFCYLTKKYGVILYKLLYLATQNDKLYRFNNHRK